MKVCLPLLMATIAATLAVAADESVQGVTVEALRTTLKAPVLPGFASKLTWDVAYRRLDALDAQADEAWRNLATREAYDARRRALHEKMVELIGGFPERTPLNARTLGVVQKKGYHVEKLVFESFPGVYVTANLFLPDSRKEGEKLAAVVLSCGHAQETGKDCDTYQRACVHVVSRGMAALMFDPYEQGERADYVREPGTGSCDQHTLTGLKAMLVGWSMPMLRIWDAMRAIDYVQSRPEVDPDRIGFMGQSGGGTMTALMTAVDWRLKATAPSCYLTSLSDLCFSIGPQDGEQNIFGQLKYGLNHTGYALLPDTRVCVTGRYSDFFPYIGAAQLYRTVQAVAAKVGTTGNYAFNFSPGPHGWMESTESASADWMAAWLQGRTDLLPLAVEKYPALDLDPNLAAVDKGLVGDEIGVTPERRTMKLPGARKIHDVLRDRLSQLRLQRPATRTPEEWSALVRARAGITLPGTDVLKTVTRGTDRCADVQVTRLAFVRPDGLYLPAVLLEGPKPDPAVAPVLLAAAKGRADCAAEAAEALAKGARVLVADVSGAGEIGEAKHVFYGAKDTPEEGTSIMLYLMGESMVGHRATDLLALGEWLARRYGKRPALVARGSVGVAAAHARVADRRAFAGIAVVEPPASWTEFLERPGRPLDYRYTSCVNGALADYDWTDLMNLP